MLSFKLIKWFSQNVRKCLWFENKHSVRNTENKNEYNNIKSVFKKNIMTDREELFIKKKENAKK